MDVCMYVRISLQPAPKGGNGNQWPFGGNQSGGEKKPKFDSPGGGKGKGKGKGSPFGGKGTPPPNETSISPRGSGASPLVRIWASTPYEF